MLNFLNEAHGSFDVEPKDYKRMTDLWEKRSNGEGVASKITDPGKAAARYVAGLIVAKEEFPDRKVFDTITPEAREIDWRKYFGTFWPFARKAKVLGITYESLYTMYKNAASENVEEEIDPDNEYEVADNDAVEQEMAIINDRKKQYELETTHLWFNNLSAAFLFEWEESGQISDGKYEGSKPWNHWIWLNYGKEGIHVNKKFKPYSFRLYNIEPSIVNGRYRSNDPGQPKRYNLNDFINKDICVEEMLCYGRLGKALPNTQASFDKYQTDFRSICEHLGEEKKFEFVDEFMEDIVQRYSYQKSYVDKYMDIFSQQDYEAYYNTKYTIKDLRNDLHSMDATVNNFDSRHRWR